MPNSVPFVFDSDLSLVALVDQENGSITKTLLPLCQITHKAFEQSVPDISLQHHTLQPMTVTKEVHC